MSLYGRLCHECTRVLLDISTIEVSPCVYEKLHLHSNQSCRQTPSSIALCIPLGLVLNRAANPPLSDLLRRLPPHSTTANLNRICALAPQLTEDLLSSVDQPLEVRQCKETGRDYLLCDYNRDGDRWRSPWSNEFYPELGNGEEGAKPSDRVRKMEVSMGEGVDVYREL